MRQEKAKPARKSPKKSARRSTPSAELAKRAEPRLRAKAGTLARKPAATTLRVRETAGARIQPPDLSRFPPESVTVLEKWICLACVSDVFTRHLGMAPRTAYLAIKRYTPPVAELYAAIAERPYFVNQPPQEFCPYCGSASKWHTRLSVYRIESGKATDAPRRELVRSLPKSNSQFSLIEEKDTQQHAFFEWLEKISGDLDLEDPDWLRDVSQHYLSRKEPKVDWRAQFGQIHSIRRSRRLDSGWEIDHGRLFLSPTLFDELLLVQYLISRSHRAGGLTLEGRYTLPELFVRLRTAGYLRALDIHAQNPGDALEQLVNHLGGGDTSIKFYYVVDRRDFLNSVKTLKLVTPPKPKAP